MCHVTHAFPESLFRKNLQEESFNLKTFTLIFVLEISVLDVKRPPWIISERLIVVGVWCCMDSVGALKSYWVGQSF